MGSCVSTDEKVASAGDQLPTARVITLAGALREYSSHLTAAHVLAGGDGTSSCFLCNSDSLFCDDYIPPMDPEERLQPGQLYFVFPAAKLRYPLSGRDMKELVVRASSALARAPEKGGGRRRKKMEKKVVTVTPSSTGSGELGEAAAGDSSPELEEKRICEGKSRLLPTPVFLRCESEHHTGDCRVDF